MPKALPFKSAVLMLAILMGTPLLGAQARPDAEAIRLNNRGVALMGQQFTERAAETFATARRRGITSAWPNTRATNSRMRWSAFSRR